MNETASPPPGFQRRTSALLLAVAAVLLGGAVALWIVPPKKPAATPLPTRGAARPRPTKTGDPALASNNVVPGGATEFSTDGKDLPAPPNQFEIRRFGATVDASPDPTLPGPNGWHAQVTDGQAEPPRITVAAPPGAVIGSGYEARVYSGITGAVSATFAVAAPIPRAPHADSPAAGREKPSVAGPQ